MVKEKNEIKIPTVRSIQLLLEPINERLFRIEESLIQKVNSKSTIQYYRNNDLKNLFGLSNNTIIKYRENGTLPFTRLGDIYLYNVKIIHEILERNNISA